MSKKELQRQEQTLQKIGSPFIRAATQEELKQALRYVMMKIGLRQQNFPTPEETVLILNHLQENYGYFRVEDVRAAFNMALSGVTDCETRCYENFSCAYISEIMNAYREFIKNTHQQSIQPHQLPELPKTEQNLRKILADLQGSNNPIDLYPEFAYDWLETHGYLKLNKAERWAYVYQAVDIVHRRLSADVTREGRKLLLEFENQMESKVYSGDFALKIRSLSKKLSLKNWLINNNLEDFPKII